MLFAKQSSRQVEIHEIWGLLFIFYHAMRITERMIGTKNLIEKYCEKIRKTR